MAQGRALSRLYCTYENLRINRWSSWSRKCLHSFTTSEPAERCAGTACTCTWKNLPFREHAATWTRVQFIVSSPKQSQKFHIFIASD